MGFLELFQIELMKTKRSKIIPLIFIAPILVVVSGVANISAYFTPEYTHPWQAMFIQSALVYAYYLLPLSMVVVSAMLAAKENGQEQSGLKKMLSLPISAYKLSITKFFVLVWYLFLEIVIFFIVFAFAGSWAVVVFNISQAMPLGYLLGWCIKLFISMLPCLACIWAITVFFLHPGIAMGLNIFLILPSVLVANTPLWLWYVQDYSGALVSYSLHDFTTTGGGATSFPCLSFSICFLCTFVFWLTLSITTFKKEI